MTVNLGSIIFTSVRAILKFVLTAACGTFLARRKFLDSAGTRAISQAILNVFLPALIFNKVISGIDRDEMKEVGILVLTAVLYTIIGLAFGFIVRFVTRIPRGWRYGVLAIGAFSNWGDLPLVLVSTIVASAPFNNTTDQDKGLAYVSVYIFVQNTLMFSLNGVWLVGKDFDEQDLTRESHGVVGNLRNLRSSLSNMKHRMSRTSMITSATGTPDPSRMHSRTSTITSDLESSPDQGTLQVVRSPISRVDTSRSLKAGESLGVAARPHHDSDDALRPVISGVLHQGDIHSTIEMSEITRIPSTLPKNSTNCRVVRDHTSSSEESTADDNLPIKAPSLLTRFRDSPSLQRLLRILLRFSSPPSLATISAFIIAAFPPLRALFVASSDPTKYQWVAPDSLPPLDFFLTLTAFIGNASVPSSLLILGYQLSKLELGRMPVWRGALVMAGLKLIVMPIIAIAWTQFLSSSRLMSSIDDKVLKLVMILPSAVPSATSLLYITQIMAPEGRDENVKYISVFLVIQYLMVGITLTITTVYTLNNIIT